MNYTTTLVVRTPSHQKVIVYASSFILTSGSISQEKAISTISRILKLPNFNFLNLSEVHFTSHLLNIAILPIFYLQSAVNLNFILSLIIPNFYVILERDKLQ